METEPIKEVYERLAANSKKSPRDYLNLALLATALRGDSDASFQDWLLEGVSEYPHEPGLVSLFREYLKSSISIEELSGFLMQLCERISEDRYFYITEPGWDRLIREAEFSLFRTTLDECERRLDLTRDSSSLIFYLYLMRPAISAAEPDWLEEKMGLLEDHFYSLPEWAQEEFEVIGRVQTYFQIRGQFCQRGPVCQRIDSAIEQWCLAESGKADQAVLECQYFIAANGDQLLKEFPDPKESIVDVTVPWEYIVGDVQNRIGENSFDANTARDYIFDFMARVTRRNNRRLAYMLGLVGVLFGLALAVYTLVVTVSLLVKSVMVMTTTSILSGLGWTGAAVGVAVLGLSIAILIFLVGRKFSTVRYRSIRGDVLKLLRVVPLDLFELAELVLSMERKPIDSEDNISDADIVVEGMMNDVAVEIYSVAQRCLNLAAE